MIALAWASGSACSHRRRDAGRDTPVYLLDLRRPSIGGALAGFRARRDAQLQRRLPPCVYDERPRLPVGLAVGAADQAPRACDSARGLTGKERAISRFVAPGPRVRIHLPPAASRVRTSIRSIALITSRIESTLIRRRSVAERRGRESAGARQEPD